MKTFKLQILMVLILGSLTSLQVQAAPGGPFGLGIMLFGPTGVTASYSLSESRSIDAALAWRTYPGSEVYAHGTYLWRFPDYFQIEGKSFLFFAGVGGRLLTETREANKVDTGRTFLGVRTAAGATYTLPNVPLEFFGEMGLTLDLTPATIASFGLGLGGRYYF